MLVSKMVFDKMVTMFNSIGADNRIVLIIKETVLPAWLTSLDSGNDWGTEVLACKCSFNKDNWLGLLVKKAGAIKSI